MMKSVKSRVVWIDSMKLFACILVVLGHFYMSLASTGWISSKEFYYYYPVETVYTFHVPLFFVCSGYLYQRKRTDYTLASHWKNIKSKVLSLGIPYVAFSTITLVLKIIFHNSVNNQATPILRTLLWEPTAPYWYLYALFFIFCLIPRQQHRNQLWKIFCVSLIAKVIYICILWPFQLPDIITKVVGNAVWFSFGMLLTDLSCCKVILNRYAMIICFSIGFVLSVFLCGKNGISEGAQFIVGANFVYALVCFFCKVAGERNKQITIKLSKYFMPVYLMHTISVSAFRTLLLKMGIDSLPVHICIGITASFVVPAIIYEVASKKWWLLFWIEPARALKMRGNKNV